MVSATTWPNSGRWTFSFDEESWDVADTFPTKEEAIRALKDYHADPDDPDHAYFDRAWVGQCRPVRAKHIISRYQVGWFLEHIDDERDEGDPDDSMLSDATDQFTQDICDLVEKHGLIKTYYQIDKVEEVALEAKQDV